MLDQVSFELLRSFRFFGFIGKPDGMFLNLFGSSSYKFALFGIQVALAMAGAV